MKPITARVAQTLLAAVLVAVGALIPAVASAAPSALSAAAQPACGDTASYTKKNLSELPREATDTVNLIKKGGPYPYPQDGTTFGNRENLLPKCAADYYKEFTVKTPGIGHRGAKRIVTGSASEFFYTADHYKSFVLVNVNA
ncbi:ribonuclease domain-containing protein [Allokutzneria sp. NRRL B-24872]|uniref:ribonuclease domain-containing protein n=1 Tax=Allokutzneria sp. NRRL B-24872 TaxID=1137961 RepID=UPI000A3697B6|nr:ribonuclease domain-containing protein [Allokutzneria sp. NRRL B-24872]